MMMDEMLLLELEKSSKGLILLNACQDGNLVKVQEILSWHKWDKDSHDFQELLDDCLNNACKGSISIVRYLLTSPELKKRANIHHKNESALCTAIEHSIEITEYLLTHPELKEHALILDGDDGPLRCASNHSLKIIKLFLTHPKIEIKPDPSKILTYACLAKKLDIIEYVLTSSEIKQNANIHTQKDCALSFACAAGDLKIVEYLCFSPQLKNHIDIHLYKNQMFVNSCIRGQKDLAIYFFNWGADLHYADFNDMNGFLNVCENVSEEFIDLFIHHFNYQPSVQDLKDIEGSCIYSYVISQMEKKALFQELHFDLCYKNNSSIRKI